MSWGHSFPLSLMSAHPRRRTAPNKSVNDDDDSTPVPPVPKPRAAAGRVNSSVVLSTTWKATVLNAGLVAFGIFVYILADVALRPWLAALLNRYVPVA